MINNPITGVAEVVDVIPGGEGVKERLYHGIKFDCKLGSAPQETTQHLCQQRTKTTERGLRVIIPGVYK